jgi:hypothetical protein
MRLFFSVMVVSLGRKELNTLSPGPSRKGRGKSGVSEASRLAI